MTFKINPMVKVLSKLGIVTVLFLGFATGCNLRPTWTPPPTSTPAPTLTDTPTPSATAVVISENSIVTLKDGSFIILRSSAAVEVKALAGTSGEPDREQILITKGEIMVVPVSTSSDWLTVVSTEGHVAKIKGCAMTVNFNPVKDSFGLGCIGGECEIGKDAEHMITASSNKDWLYQGGIYFEPTNIDFNELVKFYGSIIPDCVKISEYSTYTVSTPLTLTPTETPDISATSTASCATFRKIFPATPCPNQ